MFEAIAEFVSDPGWTERRTGIRITGINETTRDAVLAAVRVAVASAVADGLSPQAAAGLIAFAPLVGLLLWAPVFLLLDGLRLGHWRRR